MPTFDIPIDIANITIISLGIGVASRQCQPFLTVFVILHALVCSKSYNVLLPNSQDGWWNFKMYNPPLGPGQEDFYTWEHRKSLLRERIGLIDADVVCLQEVSPLSFEEDFAFMTDDLGYDGVELFRKGRFRPATFWKKDRVELATPAMHKDRTLLTPFRLLGEEGGAEDFEYWHVLNCHLQAGKQGGRRVRQIFEGVATAFKTAKNKLKEKNPENIKLIVCGDYNGGSECGAVQLLEKGSIGPDFIEDGEKVSSKEKVLPIPPLVDALSANGIDRGGDPPPATLVVPELISLMVKEGDETAYTNPKFSEDVLDRLHRIYSRFATVPTPDDPTQLQMGKSDVERWLTIINLQVGRGTEFRNAAKYMGWVEPPIVSDDSDSESKKDGKSERPPIYIPNDGILNLDDFIGVYLDELRQGKFWGIAWDLAALGEALPVKDVFRARYDHMYCSSSLLPAVVLDTISDVACPNASEPSDHLPVCASFVRNKV